MSQSQDLMESRYGRKTTKRSPLVIGIVSLISAIFFSFAIYASFVGKPLASVELTSYEAIDAGHIRGNFFALTGDQAASCVFKAYNTAGAIVGYTEVLVPAHNDDTKPMSTLLKTVVQASVLKADGCSVK
ncbi:MAG: hypothetical protein RIS26_564 [Actinomycetota bacterium]